MERIFRDKKVKGSVPDNLMNKRPSLLFIYQKTIRNKILNYKEVIESLKVGDIIENWNSKRCDCDKSPYMDKYHGHVITGDIDIVDNKDLKNILKEGPNFRIPPRKTDFKRLSATIKNDIKTGVEQWAIKESVPLEAFTKWKNEVYTQIDIQLSKIKL